MRRRAVFLFVIFVSGCAGVLYQTVWQRLLTLFTGADIFSSTIVVTAFMAGLGIGSACGGHFADRLTARRALTAFALCEIAIAAFGAISANVFYDGLYIGAGAHRWPQWLSGLTVFAIMLWPTFFMGMSLPFAARCLAASPTSPGRWLPALYGWNTLGAGLGSLTTVLALFPNIDLRNCLIVGAACSAACAVSAFGLAEASPAADATDSAAGPRVAAAESGAPGLWLWGVLYGLSGFVALSLEIVWFRVFGVALKSNSRTFGALLGIYLVGVGLGALLASWRRIRVSDPRRAFLFAQAAVPITAAALVGIALIAIRTVPWLAPLNAYLASANPPGSRTLASWRIVILYATVPVALMLPSCLLMGYAFSMLQQAVQRDLARLGRYVGWLQAANIVGSALGALLTGLVLLDVFGAPGTMRILVLCGGVFLAVMAVESRVGKPMALAVATAAIAAVLLLPTGHKFWSDWHAADPAKTIVREDATGVVLLREEPAVHRTNLLLSGFSQSWLPYGSVHTVLGSLPALMHPDPTRVAVIGLGSGDTVFAIGGRESTRQIDSIEIVRPQLDALRALDAQDRYPALRMLLHDNRVAHHFGDGRAFLRACPRCYDIVEADAIPPWGAYAGNLYSVEFFNLVRNSLKPRGLAVTWTPTERTRASFVAAFPYVLMFPSVAIGSSDPVEFDAASIYTRIGDGFSRQYFAQGGIDIQLILAGILDQLPVSYGPFFDRSGLSDVNADLFPKDEFGLSYHGPAFRPPSVTKHLPR